LWRFLQNGRLSRAAVLFLEFAHARGNPDHCRTTAAVGPAAGRDLASFTILNFLILAFPAVFFAIAAGLSPTVIGWHLLAGIFALGYIGGDAKLFAAVALWLLASFPVAALAASCRRSR